jgi:hypothetical protein
MVGAEYKTRAHGEDTVISQEYSQSEIEYLFYITANIDNVSCKCSLKQDTACKDNTITLKSQMSMRPMQIFLITGSLV